MKLSEHQQVFSKHIARLIRHAELLGIDMTFGEAHRTNYQQKEYLRTGKTKTLASNHLKRLAVDFNFFIDGALFYEHELITKLGAYWESLDPLNRWGGNFKSIKDTPHFERNI